MQAHWPAAVVILMTATRAWSADQAPKAPEPIRYTLQSGWYADRPIQYYNFGPTSLEAGNLYRLSDGSIVFSSTPESANYTAVRALYDVRLSAGVTAESVHSEAAILALVRRGGARLVSTGRLLNVPVVPPGSPLENDPAGHTALSGWFEGHRGAD